MSKQGNPNHVNRRDFIKTQSALIGSAALLSSVKPVFAAGSDELRIALIGCGGRGNGAAGNNLESCENTKIVAVADALRSKAEEAAKRWNVSPENAFWGLDAYKKALAVDGVNMVILATPPGFRPLHYSAAIAAGKHVFMEKPVCVDAPGYRLVQATNKIADQKGLKVGVGLQRRHQASYLRGIDEIRDGKYGDLILLRAYWNGGGIWWRKPEPGWTEMMKQVNNWYHFVWLCGDNICEQHVHNLDVCNWAKGEHPVEANGMGGSEIRKKTFGETQIFDHHFVEFTYSDGAKMYSQCRHAPNTYSIVSEFAHGTKGNGRVEARAQGRNPYEQEHIDLVDAIRNNKAFNEGYFGATSTFTAVLGRMATYSGKVIKWEDAEKHGKDLAPGMENYTMDTVPPVVPDANGEYPIAVPGVYDPFDSPMA